MILNMIFLKYLFSHKKESQGGKPSKKGMKSPYLPEYKLNF